MYLGLDIGTTATKAALVDEHRAIVATATAGYSLYQPTPEISEFNARPQTAVCPQEMLP
jgi:sugar (pentulose or hexulose) kinase